jgi:ATP synthase protein I
MKSADNDRLHSRVEQQTKRLRQAEQERPTLLAQTVYLGTLGLVFVLPVIAGAYLGAWLDGQLQGYSLRWTLSLIFLGLVVGAINVWLMIRE